MSHFAKVLDGKVIQVIVAEPEFFETFIDTSPGEWIQTSYNTLAGKHLLGGTPLRKNFAGIGFTYDKKLDAFIPPKIHKSWLLDEQTCTWLPPIAAPSDITKRYSWDDETETWITVEEHE